MIMYSEGQKVLALADVLEIKEKSLKGNKIENRNVNKQKMK